MAEQIVRDYSRESFFPSAFKRNSWGAVFAGAIVAVMISLVLGLLGIAIGLSTSNPMSQTSAAEGMKIGAMAWWAGTTLVAFYIGGCVAGRMAGVGRRVDAVLHGVVAWGLATLFTIFVLTSAIGGLLGGATTLLSGVAQNPQIHEPSGSGNVSEAAKSKMKQALEAAGKSPKEADQTVEAWSKEMNGKKVSEPAGAEAAQTERQAGAAVLSGTTKAAWAAFIALMIGLIGGALGGASGYSRDADVDVDRTATV